MKFSIAPSGMSAKSFPTRTVSPFHFASIDARINRFSKSVCICAAASAAVAPIGTLLKKKKRKKERRIKSDQKQANKTVQVQEKIIVRPHMRWNPFAWSPFCEIDVLSE